MYVKDEAFSLLDQDAKSRSQDDGNHVGSPHRRCLLIAVSILTGLVIGISMIELARLTRPALPNNDTFFKHCGNSLTEARTLGCQFDTMTYAWTPQECYNQTLSESYFFDGNWTWTRDILATQNVTQQEYLEAKYEWLWISYSYHVKHCEYTLRRQIQSLVKGTVANDDLMNEGHMIHCLEEIQVNHNDNAGVEVIQGFLSCRTISS